MSIHKTEAIILKTLPFRSSSLIITFFTPGFGKVRGVVKGVHREGERRQAGFELFTHAEFIFYEKKRSDLHLISDAAILDSNNALRNRLESIAFASYFCELVDELTEVHDPHPKLFDLLKAAFRFLPVIAPQRLASLFEIKLLREMGWLPYLESCLGCGARPLEQGYFSVRQGALLCEKCRSEDTSAQPMNAAVLSVLRSYSKDEIDDCLRATHTPLIENQIRFFMIQFLNYRLGKVLKTRKFLESIKPALKIS
ncbi:MAG TPA: DNA repair protein RecO [Candidatus Omnitrophota bacterium]|nr:DNA repair protein RecO [Candidatus Omnitrophota bacterium]HPS37379.1 DNA repair protein RecO [Candidatus Omnitrophota bacterium]